jgi:hypothetical protein
VDLLLTFGEGAADEASLAVPAMGAAVAAGVAGDDAAVPQPIARRRRMVHLPQQQRPARQIPRSDRSAKQKTP